MHFGFDKWRDGFLWAVRRAKEEVGREEEWSDDKWELSWKRRGDEPFQNDACTATKQRKIVMRERHETKWENWIRISVERNSTKSSRPSFNEDSLNNEEEVKGMYEKSIEQTDVWEGGYSDITWLQRHLKSTAGSEEASLNHEELTKMGIV
jgi:hypothetical protein